MSESRQDLILNRLLTFYSNELGIYSSVLTRAEWGDLPLARQYRFGWMPPADVELDGGESGLVGVVSPEMLAAVTDHLDEVGLDAYLTVVELAMTSFVQFRESDDAGAIERRIENALWELAPESIALRSEVEMHALDAGIVPMADEDD